VTGNAPADPSCGGDVFAAPGRPAVSKGRLPLGLATACADLGAQVTAVQARLAVIEAACTPIAERLPAYALFRSIPGI